MEILIGLLLLLIFGIVTWCVASEGAWGAGLILLSVMFSGLLTMNYFESLAIFLEETLPSDYADIVAFAGLFTGFVFLFRIAFERIAPTDIELPAPVYQGGRWGFAVLTGYLTMAIMLTAVHTAPLPREFIGFKPERKNFLNISAPDRQWLGFTQYVSENVFRNSVSGKRRIFDGLLINLPGRDDVVWPTFAIRYATRRGGGATASSGSGLSGNRPKQKTGKSQGF